MKVYNYKEIEKIIRRSGFSFISQKGSHRKYKRGPETIILKQYDVNRMIWQRLVKEHNLNVTF